MKFELTSGQRSIVSSVEAFTQGEFKPQRARVHEDLCDDSPEGFLGMVSF